MFSFFKRSPHLAMTVGDVETLLGQFSAQKIFNLEFFDANQTRKFRVYDRSIAMWYWQDYRLPKVLETYVLEIKDGNLQVTVYAGWSNDEVSVTQWEPIAQHAELVPRLNAIWQWALAEMPAQFAKRNAEAVLEARVLEKSRLKYLKTVKKLEISPIHQLIKLLSCQQNKLEQATLNAFQLAITQPEQIPDIDTYSRNLWWKMICQTLIHGGLGIGIDWKATDEIPSQIKAIEHHLPQLTPLAVQAMHDNNADKIFADIANWLSAQDHQLLQVITDGDDYQFLLCQQADVARVLALAASLNIEPKLKAC